MRKSAHQGERHGYVSMHIDCAVSSVPMTSFKQGDPAGQAGLVSLDPDTFGCIRSFPCIVDLTGTNGRAI